MNIALIVLGIAFIFGYALEWKPFYFRSDMAERPRSGVKISGIVLSALMILLGIVMFFI